MLLLQKPSGPSPTSDEKKKKPTHYRRSYYKKEKWLKNHPPVTKKKKKRIKRSIFFENAKADNSNAWECTRISYPYVQPDY
jgi:hypothetical protein